MSCEVDSSLRTSEYYESFAWVENLWLLFIFSVATDIFYAYVTIAILVPTVVIIIIIISCSYQMR
jgi:hypothetical protein